MLIGCLCFLRTWAGVKIAACCGPLICAIALCLPGAIPQTDWRYCGWRCRIAYAIACIGAMAAAITIPTTCVFDAVNTGNLNGWGIGFLSFFMRSGDWLPTPFDRVAVIQNLLRVWHPHGDLTVLPDVYLAQLLVAGQYVGLLLIAGCLQGKNEHALAAIGRCTAIPYDYCYQIWKICQGREALVSAGPIMMSLSGWFYITYGPLMPTIAATAWYLVSDGKQLLPQNGIEEQMLKGIVVAQGLKATAVSHMVKEWAMTAHVEAGHITAFVNSGAVMCLEYGQKSYYGSGLQLGRKHFLTVLHCLGERKTCKKTNEK
eukprot:2310820-Amphidinium_carterae.1